MVRRLVAALALMLGTTADAQMSAPAAIPAVRPAGAISYQTYCLDGCKIYWFQVQSDGLGLFRGERGTATIGAASFKVSPEHFAALVAALDQYRPDGERMVNKDMPECAPVGTDPLFVTVDWLATLDYHSEAEMNVGGGMLEFDLACNPDKNAKMIDALRNAPALIPELRPFIDGTAGH